MDQDKRKRGLGLCEFYTAHDLHETGWFFERHPKQYSKEVEQGKGRMD